MYLNSVQQMVSGEFAGEGLQTGFSRHGLPPQKAPLDTVYPLRDHLNSVQRMVSGGYCEGLFPDTVCWTRLRNTWLNSNSLTKKCFHACVFVSVPYKRNSCDKHDVCVFNLKVMVLGIVHICVCVFEFVFQALKQKNAHVYFLLGWWLVSSHLGHFWGHSADFSLILGSVGGSTDH